MPKGVYKRDKSKINSDSITALTDQYSKDLQGYKEFAAAIRSRRVYNVEQISDIINNMRAYIKECCERDPATIAGLILASGANKDFYYKAKAGEYDHIVFEYIDHNDITPDMIRTDPDGLEYVERENHIIMLCPISAFIEKCLLIIENDLQRRSLTDSSMARTTGAIFNLKAVFNYNDRPETEGRTVNNTLIVNTDPGQAAKAMRLLMNNE